MSSHTTTDAISPAGHRADELAAALLATLERERTALGERDVDAIEAAAAHKGALLAELNAVSRDMYRIAGMPLDAHGTAVLREEFSAAGLQALWQRLGTTLARCEQLNRRNGMIIAGCAAINRKLVDLVFGKSSTDTYSALGRVDHGTSAAPFTRI